MSLGFATAGLFLILTAQSQMQAERSSLTTQATNRGPGWPTKNLNEGLLRDKGGSRIVQEVRTKARPSFGPLSDHDALLHRYCTVKVIVAVCVTAPAPVPELAVTVTVLVPAGVPGFAGVLEELPPPQPVIPNARQAAATSTNHPSVRRLR